MLPLQVLDTAYKITVITASGGGVIVAVWKRRPIINSVSEFFAGLRAIVAMRPDLEFVVRELKPNSGSTLKDRVTKLEKESTRQLEILENQNGVLDEMKQQNKQDLQELRNGFKDLSERFTRFVKHEADNDLHYSKLAEEERKRAREIEGDQGKT